MVRVHFGPPLLITLKGEAGRCEMGRVTGTRKPALGNMPAAYCSRRGFSAEKRVHFGPPLLIVEKRVHFGPLFLKRD